LSFRYLLYRATKRKKILDKELLQIPQSEA